MRPIPFTQFCDRVLGVRLEPAQRVFWGVACGEFQPGDLHGRDLTISHEVFGPLVHIDPQVTSVVGAVKGADVGFSFVGGLHSLWRAITADRGDASTGEIRPSLIVAPDVRLGRSPVRTARGYAESIPAIAALIESTSADSIVFRREGGWYSSVECLPATVGGRATRGRRYLDAKLDEASFFRDETGAVSDVAIFQSIAPRCVGQVWLGSTPWLETNLIWKVYEENFGAPKTALAARMPTLLVRTNKRTRDMVERERERDPENASREFDCLPLSGATSTFFDFHSIERAFVDGLAPFAISEST